MTVAKVWKETAEGLESRKVFKPEDEQTCLRQTKAERTYLHQIFLKKTLKAALQQTERQPKPEEAPCRK